MPYTLSDRSKAALSSVDARLRAVVERAIQITEADFTVVQGRRTHDEHMRNYGKGRTAAQMTAKGFPAAYARPGEAKVTWITVSNHESGKAVDIYPFFDGSVQLGSGPREMAAHAKIRTAMLKAADELKTPLRLGCDWDGDGKLFEKGETDIVHYELKGL